MIFPKMRLKEIGPGGGGVVGARPKFHYVDLPLLIYKLNPYFSFDLHTLWVGHFLFGSETQTEKRPKQRLPDQTSNLRKWKLQGHSDFQGFAATVNNSK